MEEQTAKTRKKEQTVTEVKTNPLRNEKIFVRFVPKNTGLDKRHAMWGGRADGAFSKLPEALPEDCGAEPDAGQDHRRYQRL